MRRVMVMNSKGGSGKTTIATNLAAYYASRGHGTVLYDYDPQASSSTWLKARRQQSGVAHIEGHEAYHQSLGSVTRSWLLRVPAGTDRIVLDTPSGVRGQDMADLVKRVDTIIIPVQPSPVDIRAASDFIRDLLLIGKVRSYPVRVAVVANRVRKRTLGFRLLQRFLQSLNIPFVALLRDTQNYVQAAEYGLGIHELNTRTIEVDLKGWRPLLDWIEREPETERAQIVRRVAMPRA